MQTNYANRKPAPLIVLTLLAVFGVLFAASADAEDSIFSNVNLVNNTYLNDMLNGDVEVASSHHASLHLSTESQTQSARYVGPHENQMVQDSGVHLSWKMSW